MAELTHKLVIVKGMDECRRNCLTTQLSFVGRQFMHEV